MNRRRSQIITAVSECVVSATLTVATAGLGFVDITRDALDFVAEARGGEGALMLFVRHTSASLTIQENADPDVLADLATALERLAPQGGWRHETEGPDDMPAHIKAMLTATSLQVPISKGALLLGTWQGIYLMEHRTQPHRREVVMQFMGSRR